MRVIAPWHYRGPPCCREGAGQGGTSVVGVVFPLVLLLLTLPSLAIPLYVSPLRMRASPWGPPQHPLSNRQPPLSPPGVGGLHRRRRPFMSPPSMMARRCHATSSGGPDGSSTTDNRTATSSSSSTSDPSRHGGSGGGEEGGWVLPTTRISVEGAARRQSPVLLLPSSSHHHHHGTSTTGPYPPPPPPAAAAAEDEGIDRPPPPPPPFAGASSSPVLQPQPPMAVPRPLFQRAVALLRCRLHQLEVAAAASSSSTSGGGGSHIIISAAANTSYAAADGGGGGVVVVLESAAISLSGGASMVWKQEEEDEGQQPGPPPPLLPPQEQQRPMMVLETGEPPPAAAVLGVGEGGGALATTTAASSSGSSGGGGGMYDWLTGPGWLVVRMRHHGFNVGILFVKLSSTTTTTSEGEERAGREVVKAVARRTTAWLMETSTMRHRYAAWSRDRRRRASTGLQQQGEGAGGGGAVAELLPPRPRAQGQPQHRQQHGGEDGHGEGEVEGDERQQLKDLKKAVTDVVVLDTKKGEAEDLLSHVDPSMVLQQGRGGQPLRGVIWRLALPLMGSLAMEPVMSLFDTFYVGNYMGAACLSALGLADRVVCASTYIVTFVLSTPTTPLVARLRGEGRALLAYAVVKRLCWGAACLGTVLVPVLYYSCVPLVRLLGASAQFNMVDAVAYYRMRSLGAPAILVNAVAAGALRGMLDSTTPLLIALAAFLLDYTLQPAWLPRRLQRFIVAGPHSLGGFGATTVLAEYLAAILFSIKLWQLRPAAPVRGPKGLTSSLVTALFQGLSVFTRLLLYQLLLVAATFAVVARAAGPLDLAAHQVSIQLWLLPSVVFDGLAVAGQGLVGDCVGRQRVVRARKVARHLLGYGLGIGAALGLGYAVVGRWTPALQIFTRDTAILDKVRHVTWWFFPVLMPLTGFVQVGAGVLQGASDFHFQAKWMALCVVCACGLLTLLGSGVLPWGLPGVWLSLVAFQALRAVGFAWRFWAPHANTPLTIHNHHSTTTTKQGAAGLGGLVRAMVGGAWRLLTGRGEEEGGEEEAIKRRKWKKDAEELWYF